MLGIGGLRHVDRSNVAVGPRVRHARFRPSGGLPRRWSTETAGATRGDSADCPAFGVACEPMSAAVAPDDIVERHADVALGARPPLLVLEPLRAFLDAHDLGAGVIKAQPIGDGHSNVTYLIERDNGPEMVLRRPPRPPLPPSAHDVLREARLLRALEPTQARVPRVLAVCEDEALIGCPFYIMERVAGEVIVWETPAALDVPEQRRAIAEQLIDALVEIHGVDWKSA